MCYIDPSDNIREQDQHDSHGKEKRPRKPNGRAVKERNIVKCCDWTSWTIKYDNCKEMYFFTD